MKFDREQMQKEFKEKAEPLIQFIRTYYHPHTRIVIDYESAEVVVGDMCIKSDSEIPD